MKGEISVAPAFAGQNLARPQSVECQWTLDDNIVGDFRKSAAFGDHLVLLYRNHPGRHRAVRDIANL